MRVVIVSLRTNKEIHKKYAETVLFVHPSDGSKPLPSWNVIREAPSIDNIDKWSQWVKEVAMQKYWAARYPFLGLNYNSEVVDKSIVNFFFKKKKKKRIKDVEKPADPYSEDVCNIPLPEQTAEEIECLLN